MQSTLFCSEASVTRQRPLSHTPVQSAPHAPQLAGSFWVSPHAPLEPLLPLVPFEPALDSEPALAPAADAKSDRELLAPQPSNAPSPPNAPNANAWRILRPEQGRAAARTARGRCSPVVTPEA